MFRSVEPVTVGKRVFSTFSEKNVSFMAAGIAYNAFVSLVPLLLVVLLFVSLFGGGLEERLVTTAETSLPGPIADIVVQVFVGDSSVTGMSVIGVVVLVWGTLKVFRGLDTAFSEIYETEESNTFSNQLADGIVVLGALVVSAVLTVAVSTVFTVFSKPFPTLRLFSPVLLVSGLVVAFLPMYYRFPDADLDWQEALPGAVFAALGWAALQAVFQVYLLFGGGGSRNVFGGVIVVVTWLYFSGLVLLVGAVLNAVVGRSTDVSEGTVRRTASEAGTTESKRTVERDELASYLRTLRTQLTGHAPEADASMNAAVTARPASADGSTRECRSDERARATGPPVGDVVVVERAEADGDGCRRSVTLRWRTGERTSER